MIVARTDAAGYIHLAHRHVIPEALQRLEEVLVAGLRPKVGSSRVQVDGTYGVANDLVLIPERLMVLLVLPATAMAVNLVVLPGPEKAVSAHVDKELGLVEVLGVLRIPGKLDQCHLDFRVAVCKYFA